VIFIDVAAGTPHKEIVLETLQEITRINLTMVKPYASALRVAKWHKWIFRQPPIVVLRALERPAGRDSADLGSAARALLRHGLCVVVDSSDNSLQAVATTTERQEVLQVEYMPRDILEAVPELEKLLGALKEAGLADLVWAVLGGNPASYRLLNGSCKAARYADVTPVAEAFMELKLRQAVHAIRAAKIANPAVQLLFELFKNSSEGYQVPAATLEEHKVTQPSPDKVLRLKGAKDDEVLVPASPAVGLVLRHGQGGKAPSFAKLREMFAEHSTAASDDKQQKELQ
jgi:hypothetical protein